jgi:hypothetical protein
VGSVLVNSKVASLKRTVPVGPSVNDVSGAVWSTTHW